MSATGKRGRPTAGSTNKQLAIKEAALKLFTELGYDKTTIRKIASIANVDPKLVLHYFGNKASLFAQTFSLPSEAITAVHILQTNSKDSWGDSLTSLVLDNSGFANVTPLVGLIRAAASDDAAAEIIKSLTEQNSIQPALTTLGVDASHARASLLSALLVGLTFSDQILRIGPGSDREGQERKKLAAQVIQTVLTCQI